MVKYADSTNVVGLITNDNEVAYRKGVQPWCRGYDLKINIEKTKALIVDFRENKSELPTEL